MTIQKAKQQRQGISRFLTYVLGHRPDEFGLTPDEQGFVAIRDLLQALSEEDGWKFVRQGHLEDLIRDPDRTRFEMTEKTIRVFPGDTQLTLGPLPRAVPPSQLYHAARRKAYPVILEQGLKPTSQPRVQLFTTPELALRVGRRRDPDPVLLTVHAEKARERGVTFYLGQELIYLVDALAPDLFTGPPLPKEEPLPEKKKKPAAPEEKALPGSFVLDQYWSPAEQFKPDKSKKKKKGDEPDWKRASRKERRKRDF